MTAATGVMACSCIQPESRADAQSGALQAVAEADVVLEAVVACVPDGPCPRRSALEREALTVVRPTRVLFGRVLRDYAVSADAAANCSWRGLKAGERVRLLLLRVPGDKGYRGLARRMFSLPPLFVARKCQLLYAERAGWPLVREAALRRAARR